ncbi:MAG: small multi-drug export protein [Clostridia bacterium]|nr:small multi-drug export protein [Clostridia bacterium]
MAETFAQAVIDRFGDSVSSELLVFLISLLPILELRGGMIAARILGLPFLKAFVFCFIGNMVPIPFILLFIRRIFQWLKRFSFVNGTIERLEARSVRKAATVKKYRLWGLLLLVAIPLPGTGAWTGALVADLLDIRIKHALPVIAAGVLIAGAIMSAVTYGIF